MEKIISIIEHDKMILEKECNIMEDYYEKLNIVLSGIKIGQIDINGIEDIEVIKILMRAFLALELNKDYNDDLFKETAFLDEIIKRKNIYDVIDVIDCLDSLFDDVSIEDLLGLFKNDKITLDFSKSPKKVKDVTKISAKIIELKSLVDASKFPMANMLQYMYDNNITDGICKTVCYGCCLKMQLDSSYSINPSTITESVYLGLCTDVVSDGSYSLDHKTKAALTDLRKRVNAHDEIIKFLQANKNKDEIIGIPAAYKKLEEESQYDLVRTIYKHNMIYNKTIEKQYNKSSQDQVKLRKQLLQKYNISSEDLFYEYDYDELEDIFKTLDEFNIINDKNIVEIVKNIDDNKLKTIAMQYKLGFINSEFVFRHKEIIDKDNDELYKNCIFNIRKLKEEKISKEIINKNNDILLTDSKIISNNLGIIDTYLYQDALKGTENINFIKEEELANKIDILLELGFEANLDKDLSLLGYDISRYNRLEICNRLNILPEETSEIKAILDKDKFIIKDDCLDDYILDLSVYTNNSIDSISKSSFLEKLSQFQISNRLYEIDGVKISRFKIEREIQKKDSVTKQEMFDILSKNKKLDVNNYNSLIEFISSKKIGNKKIKVEGKNC